MKKTGLSTRLGGLIALVATVLIITVRKTYLEVMTENSN
jgi:hypothetical protein